MIPVNEGSCGSHGSLIPTEQCPSPGAVEYEATVTAQFNQPLEGFPLPSLMFGFVPGDAAPAVEGAIQRFFVSVGNPPAELPPVPGDVPGPLAWQLLIEGEADYVGLRVPLAYAAGIIPYGTPAWVRFEVTDASGCVQNFYVYLADGFPEHADEGDVNLYWITGSDVDTFTVPAADNDEDPGDAVTHGIEWTPECPAPASYVPVGPSACGAPIPVELGSAPVEVSGPDGGAVLVTMDSGTPVEVLPKAVVLEDATTSGFGIGLLTFEARLLSGTATLTADNGTTTIDMPPDVPLRWEAGAGQQLASGRFEVSVPAGSQVLVTYTCLAEY